MNVLDEYLSAYNIYCLHYECVVVHPYFKKKNRNLILQQFQVRELGKHIIGQLSEIIGEQFPICLKLREWIYHLDEKFFSYRSFFNTIIISKPVKRWDNV